MKKAFVSAALGVLCVCAGAQTGEWNERLDSVVVSVSRAGKSTPVTYTMVSKDELRAANPLSSLPMVLALQPSVVVTNEGGTGLGYSKMTVRGSKGSQINVTLNGITLNDSESQEVFWVNIPALPSILSSVQVQRGLGTSASGAGAFGASINMNTAFVGQKPYYHTELGRGSYRTTTLTVSGGTGLLRNGLYVNAAYSYNDTDGYIRNAWAKVQSAFVAAGWLSGSRSLRFTWLMGNQHTGITWNGISLEQYAENRRYNDAGEWKDSSGNVHYYDNESDNYAQHHLQANYTQAFDGGWTWSTTLNWTKGDGYYEQYKAGKKFTKYGWPSDAVVGGWPAKTKGDFIIRKEMDNGYAVVNSEVKYEGGRLRFAGGVNVSEYFGRHFGKVLWSKLLGDGFDYASLNAEDASNNWYYNTGLKRELNLFARSEYAVTEMLTGYADLQYRGIWLQMDGIDDEEDLPLEDRLRWHFFNPRAGLTFAWNPENKAYASVALGHREPGRSDLKEVIASRNLGGNLPELKPEKMVDVEAGYAYASERFSAGANLYLMEYFDMLLETGRLSETGRPLKNNVDRAFRRGVEVYGAWEPASWLRLDGNMTLSLNKIKKYEDSAAAIDGDWNELGYSVVYATFEETDILMSPSFVGMARAAVKPFPNAKSSLRTTTVSMDVKGVGRQFVDNTGNPDRTVPAYWVAGLAVQHEFDLKGTKLGVSAYVDNLFNRAYYADGGAWKYWNVDTKSLESGMWVYPQTPRHMMVKISYRF